MITWFQYIAATTLIVLLFTLTACNNTASDPSVIPDRAVSFPMPESPQVYLAMNIPDPWVVEHVSERDIIIRSDDSQRMVELRVTLSGRLIDWIGFDDGTDMLATGLVDTLEQDLNAFTVTSTTDTSESGYREQVVAFSYMENAVSMDGLAYVTGDPYGTIVISNGIQSNETLLLVRSVIDTIEITGDSSS